MVYDLFIQSLVFTPLVFGVYLSYYVLRIPDLTVESSFVAGAVAFTRALEFGVSPMLSVVIGLLSGGLSGFLVSLLQVKERIPALIAGILMLFMMYPINLILLNRPNVSLIPHESFFEISALSHEAGHFLIVMCSVTAAAGLLWAMLASRTGLMLRAFGVNVTLFRLLGKRADAYRTLGLVVSNGLAALSGILTALHNGYTDVNMGVGMALVGIGVVIIAHHLEGRFVASTRVTSALLFCLIASLLYFLSMNLCLLLGLNPLYLKVVMGGLLIILLTTQPKQMILNGGRS
jgi:putative ABC transport system permease protein